MKIVVTGALGHIGSRLIREIPLTYPDAQVVMIDNLVTQRYCSLFHLPTAGRYQFIEANVVSSEYSQYIREADVVIHLAAIADATGSFDHPDVIRQVNYEGTKRVAALCLQYHRPLIFTSSTSIYDGLDEPCLETVSLSSLHPRSPYAQSKREEEMELQTLGEKGLKYMVFRLGTICGVSPGMRFHTAVNKFCWQAAMHQPITVWTTSMDQIRPYADLADVTRALLWGIQNIADEGSTYHVVTENRTVRSVLDTISVHMPEITVITVDHDVMSTSSYSAQSTLLEQKGFSIRGSIDTCIKDMVTLLCLPNQKKSAS